MNDETAEVLVDANDNLLQDTRLKFMTSREKNVSG
jgi:hypothetical protein